MPFIVKTQSMSSEIRTLLSKPIRNVLLCSFIYDKLKKTMQWIIFFYFNCTVDVSINYLNC